MSNEARLLCAGEVAERLQISPRKLWSLTNAGHIPHVRIGKSVRYDARDLDAWLEAKKQGAGR